MRTEPEPQEVRRLVVWAFRQLGVPSPALFNIEEKTVVRKGGYTNRIYRTDTLTAIWLVSFGLLLFYASDGEILMTVNLFEEFESFAAAA